MSGFAWLQSDDFSDCNLGLILEKENPDRQGLW
jgi:hypothetical protein